MSGYSASLKLSRPIAAKRQIIGAETLEVLSNWCSDKHRRIDESRVSCHSLRIIAIIRPNASKLIHRNGFDLAGTMQKGFKSVTSYFMSQK